MHGLLVQPTAAQGSPPADSTATSRHAQRSWTPQVSLGVLGSSAVLSLWDEGIAREARRVHDGSSAGFQRSGQTFTDVGGVAPLASGLSLFLVGAATGNAFTRHLGQDATEAIVTSSLLTALIKGVVGRGRPRQYPDDAFKFAPTRGFVTGARAAFPSGHASGAFAAATVLAHELSAAHPRQRWWLNGAFYGSAGLVGLSRLYVNEHWASDVLAGAAIGTVSALKVMRHRHRGM